MAPEQTKEELFDFLYRDSGRIASYYAQLFGGRLTSLEKSDTDRRAVERASSLGVTAGDSVATDADIRSHQETQEASRRTIDPHESSTIKVFNTLKRQGHIHAHNPLSAPHGALVLAKGTLVFLDRGIIQMSALALDAAIGTEKAKGRHQDNSTVASMEFIKSLMGAILMPSAFLLDIGNGAQITGTVKESGMEEPISTYYYRHGAAGLSSVYLLGIKEVPSTALTIPGSGLMAAGQQAVKALSEMLFPAAAIRVTPILMYRQL